MHCIALFETPQHLVDLALPFMLLLLHCMLSNQQPNAAKSTLPAVINIIFQPINGSSNFLQFTHILVARDGSVVQNITFVTFIILGL